MPGIPPDSVNQVKASLRKLFKRKSKAPPADPTTPAATTTAPEEVKPTATEEAAPAPAASSTPVAAPDAPTASEPTPGAVPSTEPAAATEPSVAAAATKPLEPAATPANITTADHKAAGLSATSGPLEDFPAHSMGTAEGDAAETAEHPATETAPPVSEAAETAPAPEVTTT